MCWALLRDSVPIYPVYALLFADAGLDDGRIAALLMLWTAVAVVAEVPTGVLADRTSRRACVATASLMEAAGFLTWTLWPGTAGFAAGFVLWGVGGSLASGAFTALLYDALAAADAAERFGAVYGRVEAAGLFAQVPAAAVAMVLLAVGGFAAVGVASVAVCLLTAVAACRLPQGRPAAGSAEPAASGGRGGAPAMREALSSPAVRAVLLAGALLGGLDAVEEYIPLMAVAWGVPTGGVPAIGVAVQFAAAAGALLGARVAHRRRAASGLVTAGLAALAVGVALASAPGLVGVALFYGLLRVGQVTAEARLQAAAPSEIRATVGSVASVGVEVAALPVLMSWAFGGVGALAITAVCLGLLAVALLRSPPTVTGRGRG